MKYIVLSVFFLLSLPKSWAVNLGPFKVAKPFCEKIQQLAPILNVYTNVMWPVVGFPGVTMGLSQNTSALMDFCNFIMQVEQLGTQDAIFFTGNYLNTLTDRKWENHLEMADKTWNLANTVYDFENGQQRKGSLQSASTHREINDYMRTSYGWFNKTFNNKDAQLKTRGEREVEMNQFASAAQRRAILAEAINCPNGANTGNPNYDNLYRTQIQPKQNRILELQDDINFYKDKMLLMGPKFVNDQKELEAYIAGLEEFDLKGVTYEVTPGFKSETTTKPGKVDPKTKKPAQVKTQIRKPIQNWQARQFIEVFQNFKNKWSGQWKSWVETQFIQDSRGILVKSANEKANPEFMDLHFECSPTRLMRGMDPNNSNYQREIDRRVAECENRDMKEKQAQNLINLYTDRYANDLMEMKKLTAQIWSLESKELGISRAFNNSNPAGGFQQEQVACSDKLEPAEMQKIEIKQQQVNNELAEMQAKQLLKQTSLMEMQMQKQVDDAEESAKKQQFAEQQSKRNKQAVRNKMEPVSTSGGL